jgi:hypothetical protein
MNSFDFRKVVSVSLAGHIAVIAFLPFFGLSLCPRQARIAFNPVVFCGSIPHDFFFRTPPAVPRPLVPDNVKLLPVPVSAPRDPIAYDYYIKPQAAVSFVPWRKAIKSPAIVSDSPKRTDPVLLLHPLLPYQFDLYFKDRQAVHIELEFFITKSSDRNFVSLRRRISSGNLEADLLSMRYIGHYLFIQQARFMPNSWQSVKIEFSPNSR